MNLLLVTDSYPPEIRSASHLMLELAEGLKQRGHQVTVVTTWPQYNLDAHTVKRDHLEYAVEEGIKVIRIKTLPHHNVNYMLRGISQLLMPLQFIYKIFRYRIRVDAVIVYSPPLPLALVGSWLKMGGVGFILNVQDLFPQNAIDLGVLRNKSLIRFFQALERVVYRSADVVTVHSEGNRKLVLSSHPSIQDKLLVLHNWVDIDQHSAELMHQVDFRKKWGINQKHIAIFAGVMGPSQFLRLILEIAENLQDQTDLLFLLIGDGIDRPNLESYVSERNINNVRFEGFISRDEYASLLKICSIGLTCLSPQNKTPVVPGKILGYMAAGLPIAAFLHAASDGHQIIRDSKCGVSAASDSLSACVEAMRSILSQSDDFIQIGRSGLIYAQSHFSREACISQIEVMLSDICAQTR